MKVHTENIEQDRQSKTQKIKNLQKNIEILNKNIENFKMEIDTLKKIENNNKKSQAIIKTKISEDKRNFISRNLNVDEDIAFSKLMYMIKKANINIVSALEREDKDADGKLSRYEITTFLQRYLKNSIRVYTILNFFELNKKYNDVYIKDIRDVLEKRNIIAERVEQELLQKLIIAFKRKEIDLESFD